MYISYTYTYTYKYIYIYLHVSLFGTLISLDNVHICSRVPCCHAPPPMVAGGQAKKVNSIRNKQSPTPQLHIHQGGGAALETQESQQHQKQAGRSTRNPRKSTASETSRAPHHSSTSTGGGSTRNPRKSTASETSREKH